MTKLEKKAMAYKLFNKPLDYVEEKLKQSKKDMIIFRTLFVALNFLIAVAAATMAIITSLILSKLLFGGNKPVWFFFVATGVSAATVLLTSFVNFFVIKDRYQKAMRRNKLIKGQKALFINNAGLYQKGKYREMIFYTRVAQIVGNFDALRETSDDIKSIEKLVKKTKKGKK